MTAFMIDGTVGLTLLCLVGLIVFVSVLVHAFRGGFQRRNEQGYPSRFLNKDD